MSSTNMSQVVKQITESLTPLADKLGKSAGFVYQLAVRQAYIDGIEYFLLALLCISGIYFYAKNYKQWAYDDFDSVLFVGAIFSLVSVIALPILICCSFDCLFNPQYAAITSLLSTIKG